MVHRPPTTLQFTSLLFDRALVYVLLEVADVDMEMLHSGYFQFALKLNSNHS